MTKLLTDCTDGVSRAKYELEAMIDTRGLAVVTGWLAEIASGKADHVRETWQDEGLARAWEKGCTILMAAEGRIVKVQL